jgi:hypothetical protein
MVDCPPPVAAPWRVYPYTLVAGDPEMVFPAAEGHQEAATDTYYASGLLTGERSGRRYGFLTIFAKNERIFSVLSADFYVLALFDLDSGVYDTASEFDLPPGHAINGDAINVTRGRLEVSYRAGRRISRFRARRTGTGEVLPFAYELELVGRGRTGAELALSLCADAIKPPQAVGGAALGGRIRVMGQNGTHSYFQPLAYTGTLRWGGIEETVMGRIGWLDRQWFPDYVGANAGVLGERYGHQWSEISLDNGWEFSLWRHFDRRRRDRVVPFSGVTGTDPDGRTVFADDYAIDSLGYFRDPGLIEPLLGDAQTAVGLRSSIRYFFDAFRLRVPAVGLDVTSTPVVAAPGHRMPVDYFSGPTRLHGTMDGRTVAGFGFHERTMPFWRPRQLIIVLRDSLLYLPTEAVADSPLSPAQLADLAWQARPHIDRYRYRQARAHLEGRLRPALAPVAEPQRGHLVQILDDLIDQISFFS